MKTRDHLKRRQTTQQRVEQALAELRARDRESVIPARLRVSIGGVPFTRYSFSPWKGWISINPAACATMHDVALRRHLLHEIGHAVDRGVLWRLGYPFSFLRNGREEVYGGPHANASLANRAEQRAEAFVERFLRACK